MNSTDETVFIEGFFSMIHTQYHSTINVLKSDNDLEFMNATLTDFLTAQGTIRLLVCAHPNGMEVAERRH